MTRGRSAGFVAARQSSSRATSTQQAQEAEADADDQSGVTSAALFMPRRVYIK